MKRLSLILISALFLIGFSLIPAQAGEPTGEIGPIEPTMFRCVDDEGNFIGQFGVFEDIFIEEDFISFVQLTNTCFDDDIEITYDIDTTKVDEFQDYLDDYEDICRSEDGKLVPVRDTRIEGFVYEFNPVDPENPETTPWIGRPIKDVKVTATGITFDIFWGTDDNGYYYFDNLGAGPILIDLELPPNGNVINPNVLVKSTGTLEIFKDVNIGFYWGDYGDFEPQESQLVTPDGLPIPFLTLEDVEELSACGYDDLPTVVDSLEPPLVELLESDPGMPDVGGVLDQNQPLSITLLAIALFILLPLGGFLALRRHRSNEV